MAFDFPSSPTSGQVYQPTGGPAYQWDGEKWKGGQPSGPQNEQFFDLSGKASQDITVPTWAKNCVMTINAFCSTTATAALGLRMSMDGTTFPSGATDYIIGYPFHSSGSGGFATQASTTNAHINLTTGSDSVSNPHFATVEMAVSRPLTANSTFPVKSYGKSYNSGAAALWGTLWVYGHPNYSMPGLYQVKALRIFFSSGAAFAAGSTLHIKWLGDDAQVPISNAIADAPSDGGEYTRVNGIWRLARQHFDISGKANQDVTVPAGAKMMLVRGVVYQSTVTGACVAFLASHDGTNFMSAAANYSASGFHQYTGSAGFLGLANTAYVMGLMTFNQDVLNVPQIVDGRFQLIRYGTGINDVWTVHSMAQYYASVSTQLYVQSHLRINTLPMTAGVPVDLKKFRFLIGISAQNFGPASTLSVEWMY